MSISDLTIVRRSLRVRLFSTLATALTVGLAVGLLLTLLSLKDSGRRAFSRGAGNMHMVVSRDPSPLVGVLNNVFYANPPQSPILWRDLQATLTAPRNRQPPLVELIDWVVPTQIGDSFRGEPVVATTVDFFTRFEPHPGEPWKFTSGNVFGEEPGAFEVVLGSDAAQRTGLKVGDRIYLSHGANSVAAGMDVAGEEDHAHDDHGHDHDHPDHLHDEFPFEVVGVLAPSRTPHDRALFTDLTSAWIMHAQERRERSAASGEEVGRTTAADLIDDDRKITAFYLRAKARPNRDGTPGDASTASLQLFNAFRLNPSFTVAIPSDEVNTLFEIVGSVDQIILGIAVLVMISSGVAIMVALQSSMGQRRRQIAIMRVLGCTRGRIFGLIMTESAIIGITGVVIGALLGLAAIAGVTAALEARLGLVVEPWLGPRWIAVIAAAAVVLSVIAGLVPAVAAYRTSVTRNLRPFA
ncbi:MAG: ABC transporter permease [Phycisphaerales bacterium JB037]